MLSTLSREPACLRELLLDSPEAAPAIVEAGGVSTVLTPAAVLVPVVAREGGATVLLTQRTQHLKDHPGQISFPGGRVEPADDGPVATALRESQEEIGLDPSLPEILGFLPEYCTGTGYQVTPVVARLEPGFSLLLDDFEVADAFEVPLAFLLDPANHERHQLLVRGQMRAYHAMRYGERFIWGATAGMIMSLAQRCGIVPETALALTNL